MRAYGAAAIDDEDVAGMEVRGIGGEIGGWPFDVRAIARPAKRGDSGEVLDEGFTLGGRLGHFGDDEARCDHVGAHAILSHFDRDPVYHGGQRALGGSVVLETLASLEQ